MSAESKVYISRKFNCSKKELFRWLMQPDLLVKWFGPQKMQAKNVTVDFRIGGKYSIELLRDDGTSFFVEGEYAEIEEPEKIAFTMYYVGYPLAAPKSLVNMKLEEENNMTLLTFTQSFETVPADMGKRTAAWEYMFEKLASNLE
ncbi:MAG: SRPBCC family protein [bacterium]